MNASDVTSDAPVKGPKKGFTTWTVAPHGDIEELAENLWRVVGDIPGIPGLKRQMVVIKRRDGALVIHNPVSLKDTHMSVLDAKGPVKVLIAPSAGHRIDIATWKARYPDALVLCPPGAKKRVEEVVPVDVTYEAYAGDDVVKTQVIDGLDGREGVVIVQSADGVTLVFNDLIFNHPHIPGFMGLIVRLLGSTGGPRATLIGKLSLVKDKAAAKRALAELAKTPGLVRVIPGHVDVIHTDAAATLAEVAAKL
jgi:hypothetical protein